MRSSKSRALACASLFWYSRYASAALRSKSFAAASAAASGSMSSFFRLDTWLASARADYRFGSSSRSRPTNAISRLLSSAS